MQSFLRIANFIFETNVTTITGCICYQKNETETNAHRAIKPRSRGVATWFWFQTFSAIKNNTTVSNGVVTSSQHIYTFWQVTWKIVKITVSRKAIESSWAKPHRGKTHSLKTKTSYGVWEEKIHKKSLHKSLNFLSGSKTSYRVLDKQ